jgi:hypothetical protein
MNNKIKRKKDAKVSGGSQVGIIAPLPHGIYEWRDFFLHDNSRG